MSLDNYQINKIIAKRKAISNVNSPSPESLNKSEFRRGVESANNQIEEWLNSLSKAEVQEYCKVKFHAVNEYMFNCTSNNTYSYWLGLHSAFGRYLYSGFKFKL